MKKLLSALFTAALFSACEQKIETPAGSDKETTIVNPPAAGEKSETHTTVVNPPEEKKSETETSTTVVNPPATETKTDSTTTTTKTE